MSYQRQTLRMRPRRGAEPQRERDQPRLTRGLPAGGSQAPLVLEGQVPGQTSVTLCSRDIARLDRFVAQSQRAAVQADRAFEGVTVHVDGVGRISIHAVGMNSMLL